MAVRRELGHGFLEAVYQEALAVELGALNIPFKREFPIPIQYKGQKLNTHYRADFVCFESIIVELTALAALSGTEESQILHYLKAAGFGKALLLNFGKPRLEYRRFVM